MKPTTLPTAVYYIGQVQFTMPVVDHIVELLDRTILPSYTTKK